MNGDRNALPARTVFARLANTLASVILAVVALVAILTQSHSGNARWYGMVHLEGEAAVSAGWVLLVLSLFPLAVWMKTELQLRYWVLGCWALLMSLVFFKLILPRIV